MKTKATTKKKKAVDTKTKATDKTNKMLVSVVLDRSGSMGSTRASIIDGYNEYIKGIRADKDGDYSVTLIQFDAAGSANEPDLLISYEDRPLADVPVLDEKGYEPRGSTPLYDAIGECIRRTEQAPGVAAGERAVTMVIITDGYENASKEFTQAAIKARITEKEALHWTVVFLGSGDVDSYQVGASIGTTVGSTAMYTAANTVPMFATMAGATMARSRGNRSVGVGETYITGTFLSDTQKVAMGDPTVTGVTGGVDASSSTFPTRKWRVTT